MAQPRDSFGSGTSEDRVAIASNHGESLFGSLYDVGSNRMVIICHGYTKNDDVILDIAASLTKKGLSVFRFDVSGSKVSKGQFEHGNCRKEVEDLHSIVSYLHHRKYEITSIVGHSKGGDVALLYASIYDDVHIFVSISGLFDLDRGIEDYKENTNKALRLLMIHGSADEHKPVEDAYKFATLLNHKLQVIMGANHDYTAHRKELAVTVADFITSPEGGNTELESTPLILAGTPPSLSLGQSSSGVLSCTALAPTSSGHPYEGWTLKQLLEETRRIHNLSRAAFSSVPRDDKTQTAQTESLPPLTASPGSAPVCAPQQRTPPRRYRRTVSSLSPPSSGPIPPSDSPEHLHHLGKRLEEVLISLRDVASQHIKDGRLNEVPKILNAGSSIVASFCDAVRVPEAYKAVVANEATKAAVKRLDPEYNLLYLQMDAAIKMQQEGAEKHEILLSLDDYSRCALSMKDVVDILQPVRSITCGHIYEQSDIMVYVGSIMKDCPVPGCPGVVSADLVFQDAELMHDIRAAAHKKSQKKMMTWGAGREAVAQRLFVKELVTG